VDGVGATRSGGYPSYIGPYGGSSLRAIAHVRVNKVLFSGTKVSGVELVFVNSSGKAISSTCQVSTQNVVVSSGVFGTPKLLKLSGVGPASELTSLGIPVVVDLATVGEDLSTQYGMSVSTLGTAQTPVTGANWRAPGFLFYNVEDDPLAPNNFNLNVDIFPQPGSEIVEAIFGAAMCYGDARGVVNLSSANPDDEPAVTFNFLTTARDRLVTAIMLNQTLALVEKMQLQLVTNPCATGDCSTVLQQLNTYLSAGFGKPVSHWAGSAGIGRVLDPFTMGVYGTTGLYVLDSSVMPAAPGSNTQYTTYAVAERGVELVIANIEDRGY